MLESMWRRCAMSLAAHRSLVLDKSLIAHRLLRRPYTGLMSSLPVVNQPPHRCGALLGQLTRRLQTRSESVLTPLGLRPRHLIALTVLRDQGGSSQQDLAKTLE